MGVASLTANEEYYQLLMSSESQPCSVDVPSYTMQQVEGITSEYIVKNAVSVWTGHRVLPLVRQLAHCQEADL